MGPQLAGIRLRIPTLDVTLGVEHGDQVVNLAAAQRVVDEVGARTSPQDHIRAPEILRHLLAREHRAISDVARYQRLAVADHLVAHLRPHAVAADERTASDALARLQDHADAGVVLLEILDAVTGFQRDAVVVLARVDEDGMQIVPVSDGVGLLELLPKARLIERDAGDALAGQGAAHLHGRRPMRIGEYRLFEVELFERAKDVGAELDAGADLAEFGRLLQHPHGETLARERMGRRQASDAAARNQDRQCLTVRHRHSTDVRMPPANILSPFRTSFNCVPYASYRARPGSIQKAILRRPAMTGSCGYGVCDIVGQYSGACGQMVSPADVPASRDFNGLICPAPANALSERKRQFSELSSLRRFAFRVATLHALVAEEEVRAD